ncbi:response regulator transcription factor [Aurantiacibacter hainanensis]|uniref:response regulator transcription factor n=1 Tax=Aurantiacibacter hainanensis TaxID=3076114 RepID=UPI0030C6F5B7
MIALPSLIAVVDDDPGMRRGLSSLLKSEGYDCRVFADAREFLASPASDEADCLVTDLHMPGMDGFDLQGEMARARPTLAVIVMTAFGEKQTRHRALAAGARAFLVKPFETRELLAEIDLALGGKIG